MTKLNKPVLGVSLYQIESMAGVLSVVVVKEWLV